jgi:hypothetical protein
VKHICVKIPRAIDVPLNPIELLAQGIISKRSFETHFDFISERPAVSGRLFAQAIEKLAPDTG